MVLSKRYLLSLLLLAFFTLLHSWEVVFFQLHTLPTKKRKFLNNHCLLWLDFLSYSLRFFFGHMLISNLLIDYLRISFNNHFTLFAFFAVHYCDWRLYWVFFIILPTFHLDEV